MNVIHNKVRKWWYKADRRTIYYIIDIDLIKCACKSHVNWTSPPSSVGSEMFGEEICSRSKGHKRPTEGSCRGPHNHTGFPQSQVSAQPGLSGYKLLIPLCIALPHPLSIYLFNHQWAGLGKYNGGTVEVVKIHFLLNWNEREAKYDAAHIGNHTNTSRLKRECAPDTSAWLVTHIVSEWADRQNSLQLYIHMYIGSTH